jgi:hypothetical protein
MAVCPICGGEMHEGEVFVPIATSIRHTYSEFGIMTIPGIGGSSGDITKEERILWREKTGRKKGLIIKSEEEKTMKILGQRCIKCGYIELYVRE